MILVVGSHVFTISNQEIKQGKSILNEREWQFCMYSLSMCMHWSEPTNSREINQIT